MGREPTVRRPTDPGPGPAETVIQEPTTMAQPEFDITIGTVNIYRHTQDHSHQNDAASSQPISASCAPAAKISTTPKPMSCTWSKRVTSQRFTAEPISIETPAQAKIRPYCWIVKP